MLPQRQLLRGAPRFAARLRSPVVQRRLASSTPQAGENAFVRERRAVKEHAAGTTGEEPAQLIPWLGLEG